MAYVLVAVIVIAAIVGLLYLIAYGLELVGVLGSNPIKKMFGWIRRGKQSRPYNNTDDVDIRQYIAGRISRREAQRLREFHERERFSREIDDTGR